MIDAEDGVFFYTFPNKVGGTVDFKEKHIFSFTKPVRCFFFVFFGGLQNGSPTWRIVPLSK